MRLPATLVVLLTLASFATAADWKDIDPNVFPADDPRAKELPKMMFADAKRRMQEANLRESKAFAAVTTKEQWEKYRDERISDLSNSLGWFPLPPKDVPIRVTRKIEGDGFVIHNVVYETRKGLWVAANLYLPAKPPEKMPGILIAHAHHNGKTEGELQDMGMTWARAGTAVLVPDQLGYGERRNHDFHTAKDFDKPFRVGRQDYYHRYHSNLQLSTVGESLMGWMAWDLMRGVDVLLKQPTIDPKRIILMGAVAGGGDPAGVTAALDPRIACVVPFNFGGWQPESSVLENPDRDFAWFGDGYWESTRGLRNGARDGFAHFVIVGSVAPRKVIYSHEFGWDGKTDPAWPRLQKIFGFYDAKDSLRVAHGKGSVKGPGGADNTHCNHIGAVHRKMIYPALKDWFDMPIPEEYSKRRTSDELHCWTDEAKKELKPQKLDDAFGEFSIVPHSVAHAERILVAGDPRIQLEKSLGDTVKPVAKPKVVEGKSEEVPGGTLERLALETDPGITVPVVLITPEGKKVRRPVVVMFAQAGKAALLKERQEEIAAFLKAGTVVCLADLRGIGETRPGNSADRGSARTSVSQTNLILGQPVLLSQLRDLRTVIRWLKFREWIDGDKVALWGDSFAKVNGADAKLAVPLDLDGPAVGEPGAALLALLAGAFESVVAVSARGGIADEKSLFAEGQYLHIPHDAVVPRAVPLTYSAYGLLLENVKKYDATIDMQNRQVGKPGTPADAAKWVMGKLAAK